MGKRFRKSDIQFHRLGYGYTAVPAVNVKVYTSPGTKEWAAISHDAGVSAGPFDAAIPGFTPAWVAEHLSAADIDLWWGAALADGWEQLGDVAEGIYGRGTKVYSEGRSAGWAYIEGLASREDVAGWDAVKVARWGKFARACRAVADDTGYRYLYLILINVYEPWAEGEVRRLCRAAAEMRLSV